MARLPGLENNPSLPDLDNLHSDDDEFFSILSCAPGLLVKLAFTFDQSTSNPIECGDANGNVLTPIKQMPFLAHYWVYEFLPRALGLAGIGSFIFVAGGMAYFLIRDTFRFGRTGIPLSWIIIVIALFTAFGFLATGHVGLLVAPILGVAYTLGCRQARRDAASSASHEREPSA